MSRTLSATALRGMFAEETGIYPILLITITHPGMTEPMRLSSDPTSRLEETTEQILYGTASRGEDYFFVPFQISLPSDTDAAAPHASISIDNVSRELVPTVRRLTSPPDVTIEIVMSCSLDTVEVVYPDFNITSFSYDSLTVSGDLTVELLTAEPFPSGTFTPSQFKGMF